jgi:hypothetical protein
MGLAFWFLIGLPWGPHNESFDWVVRLEQRTFWSALFDKFPSVLGLRPLGTGPAWLLYRLGGHDVGLTQFVNAAMALFAWGWLAMDARPPRLFALLSLVVSGVFFAGYIWVFHAHGIFYGPLIVYVASLARTARGTLDPRALLGAFVGAVVTALAHPYALPLVVAFAAGAIVETPELRSRAGAATLAVVVTGCVAVSMLLVPDYGHSVPGSPLAGWITSFKTCEVNRVGAGVAALLAAWTASRSWPGRAGAIAALLTLGLAAAAAAAGLPVLPLWIAWAAARAARLGRSTIVALLAATALLPLPNPTGSPTYAIFALMVGAYATSLDDEDAERPLLRWGGAPAGIAVAVLLAVALAVRGGWPVPVASRLARPLLAEGERTRQLEVLAARLMGSPWKAEPVRFATAKGDPVKVNALDRGVRPPTEDNHLTTWLDWKRGGPATGRDTLLLAFGGESRVGMDTLFVAHGRYAGDALVLRRSPVPPSTAAAATTRP